MQYRLTFKHEETKEILETLEQFEYLGCCIDYYVSLDYVFIKCEKVD